MSRNTFDSKIRNYQTNLSEISKSSHNTIKKLPTLNFSQKRYSISYANQLEKTEYENKRYNLTEQETKDCYYKNLSVIRKIADKTLKRYNPSNASSSDSLCIFLFLI